MIKTIINNIIHMDKHKENALDDIAERIRITEKSRQELALRLRALDASISYPEMLEIGLVHKVSPLKVSGKIAAVDSGIIGEELHGFDFLLIRCVGAVFHYENSKVISHKYYPSAIPPLEYDVKSGLDLHDVILHNSLFRLKSELICALKLISDHLPAYLLLDGSIAPLLSDKPPENSEMRQLYIETIEAYKSLYEIAWNSNCALLGVIKDSRSRRFIEILQKESQFKDELSLMRTNDTNFIYFLLDEGERTSAFSYSSAPSKHQVLKDLGNWSEKILSFYLKPVKNDRPIRIEFLSGQKTFDDIASLVHSLSFIHKAYAYPAILIDVDLRAALDGNEFERAYGSLFSRLGRNSSILRLRRNMRPFR